MATTYAPILLVADFERRYRHDHEHEHALLLDNLGRKIAEHTGGFDRVSFAVAELERSCLGLLTHTHPRDLPPSAQDLALAAEYGFILRAVGVAPDTLQQFDYTIQMGAPSKALADQIATAYDDELEQAERELAKKPYGDLQWEREARHLAVSRLAERFGFSYHRTERHAALSETTRREVVRLDMLSNVETIMRDQVFAPLQASLVRSLTRYANHASLPASALTHIQGEVGNLVQRTMLGKPDAAGLVTPYSVIRGEVVPRSVYFATLWGMMRGAAQLAIDEHAAIMRRYLPDDLKRSYEMATLNPFDRELAEADGPQYDPLHLWLGPDGKRLSDRVWNAAGDLRRKLDDYLTDAISSGKSVNQIASELEEFLLPGVEHTRVDTPWGSLSYEAMRLARTEIAAAYARADSAAAQSNPFVETYQPFTAPEHACCDGCDVIVAGGPYPKDDIAHLPPYHPHCICGVLWNLVKNVKAVVKALRERIAQAVSNATAAITDWINPLSKKFLDLLFRGNRL